MSGFSYEGGQMVIRYGDRRVATTGGTLLQFLSDEEVFSRDITYPDANKNEIYAWRYVSTRAPGSNFALEILAQSVVGARAQEWETTHVLGPAPAGADLFLGRATLTRTIAPSHTWLGQTISPVVPQGVAVQSTGSILVEAALGISRTLTIDVDGGNLIAYLQHSVGPIAGDFGQWGTMPVSFAPTSTGDNTRDGGENTGTPALPVYWRDTTPYRKTFQLIYEGTIGPGSIAEASGAANATKQGGASDAVYADPTNYSSTYALMVRGRFGRRS